MQVHRLIKVLRTRGKRFKKPLLNRAEYIRARQFFLWGNDSLSRICDGGQLGNRLLLK